MFIIVAALLAVVVIGAIAFFLTGKRSSLPETSEPRQESKPDTRSKPPEAKKVADKPAPKTPKAEEVAETKPKLEPSDEPKVESTSKVDPAPEPVAPEPAEPSPTKAVETQPTHVEPPPPRPASIRPRPDAPDTVQAFKKGLATTRGGFIARLAQLFGRKKEIDPELLDEVQSVLLSADIGPKTAEGMLETVRTEVARAGGTSEEAVWAALRKRARDVLGNAPVGIQFSKKPTLILVVGVNGVGKTTTIGKLASRFKEEGNLVVLAAGDTFRAAAVTQLEVWGKRVGCEVVKGKDRADPGAVIFDAVKHATTIGADVVIADTAGRLHTKSNLMEELKKVVRTSEKALERPVDEVLLVLDATTGQNAIQQAQMFREAITVSGIVLTKLDGTAKGGVVLGIADEHHIPVRYIGIGERVEDLRPFDAENFVEALFAKPDESRAEDVDPR
jgi:fused signal recognition particle receptor